ncbi:MAG: hypothetical protein Q9223_007854 [Gallowayella weberi]
MLTLNGRGEAPTLASQNTKPLYPNLPSVPNHQGSQVTANINAGNTPKEIQEVEELHRQGEINRQKQMEEAEIPSIALDFYNSPAIKEAFQNIWKSVRTGAPDEKAMQYLESCNQQIAEVVRSKIPYAKDIEWQIGKRKFAIPEFVDFARTAWLVIQSKMRGYDTEAKQQFGTDLLQEERDAGNKLLNDFLSQNNLKVEDVNTDQHSKKLLGVYDTELLNDNYCGAGSTQSQISQPTIEAPPVNEDMESVSNQEPNVPAPDPMPIDSEPHVVSEPSNEPSTTAEGIQQNGNEPGSGLMEFNLEISDNGKTFLGNSNPSNLDGKFDSIG